MMTSPNHYYALLVESLRLMAAKASVQKVSVDDDAVVTDEITMVFAMAYPYAEQLVRDGFLTLEALQALAPIHTWAWLKIDSDAFLPEALSLHPYWANGRRLAQRALNLMGEKIQPPDPNVYEGMVIDLDLDEDSEE